MAQQTFVSYCRASTPLQVIGLEMQRRTIRAYAERIGAEIIASFEETKRASPVVAGFGRHQPELARAIEHCRGSNATLIVARLDRLTRSSALLSTLLEAGPPFVVAEIPNASPFILQIYAAVAEEYRRVASRRCRAGVQAALAQGINVYGHCQASSWANRAAAKAHALRFVAEIEDLRKHGSRSQEDVANALNARGLLTYFKRPWTDRSVYAAWRWRHKQWISSRFPGKKRNGGGEAAAATAKATREKLRPTLDVYRTIGVVTGAEVAARLNQQGINSATGRAWTDAMARKLIRRLAER